MVTICVGSGPHRHVDKLLLILSCAKNSLQFSVGDSAAPFSHKRTRTFRSSYITGNSNNYYSYRHLFSGQYISDVRSVKFRSRSLQTVMISNTKHNMSSTLMMEEARPSEMLVRIYKTTHRVTSQKTVFSTITAVGIVNLK